MADDSSGIVKPNFAYNTNVVTQLQIDHLEHTISEFKTESRRRMDILESRLSIMVIVTVTTLLATVGGLFMRVV